MLLTLVSFVAACSDDDTTTLNVPAGFYKVTITLDSTADAVGANEVRLMGFNGAGLAVLGPDAKTFDAWALTGANNLMTKGAGDTYSIDVYFGKAAGYSNAMASNIEFKFANGTPGFGASWDNKLNNGSYNLGGGAITNNMYVNSHFQVTNNGGDSFAIPTWDFTNNAAPRVIPIKVAGWLGKAPTDPSLVTTVAVTLTINWLDVPASHVNGATWANLADGAAVVTGSAAWLHTDGVATWNPGLGTAVTVTVPTATTTVTVPVGSPLGFSYKLANVAGWNQGEEGENHGGLLGAGSATQTLTVNFNYK